MSGKQADERRRVLQIFRQQWIRSMYPPYTCPFCGAPNSVAAKVNKVERLDPETRKWFHTKVVKISCTKGCFDILVTNLPPACGAIDAYAIVVDHNLEELQQHCFEWRQPWWNGRP